MRRSIFRSFIAGGVLASAFLVADVEKLRPEGREKEEGAENGKGAKPGVEIGKPGEDGQDQDEAEHMKLHRQLEAEGEKNLKEIARLMEKIRNDLSQKQTGDATQGSQKEVVKKIEDLIDKINKGCGKSGCQNSGGSSGQSQGQQSLSKQQSQKKSGSDQKRQENEKQSVNPDQKKEPCKEDKQKSNGKVPNTKREPGKLPDSKTATLAEKAEVLEKWGFLPPKLVEQMRSSSGKEYPAEYKDIISRYYERLSRLYEETSDTGGEK